MKPEESNWEKEFDEKFLIDGKNGVPFSRSAYWQTPVKVKEFISTLLASELERERSEILLAIRCQCDTHESKEEDETCDQRTKEIHDIIRSRPHI